MTTMKVKVKQEPPDEAIADIFTNEIQLTSVDKEAETLIEEQIGEILPEHASQSEENSSSSQDSSPEEETPSKKYRCKRCDYKGKTRKALDRHKARHEQGLYHQCQYCDFTTHVRQRFVEHEAKHTNAKPFECEKCEFRTRFKADLYKHRAKHSTVKKFCCTQCDFRTKWCRNIKHHMLKHTEERPHGCHICGFRFKRLQDLKYHLFRHNDVKPIQCELCSFRCKTNYELKCHSLKHSSIRNFSCTYPGCTQRTKTKSDLTKHMKTHIKDKNYLCAMCGKSFSTLQCLNKHKERHSSIRKFKCGLCEKWFKSKPSLRAHMKIHDGVKPFQCDICQWTFHNKYNMEKHKETHTGDRPYLCPICPYGARTRDHLLAHIGSVHGDSHAYFCELCRKPFKRYSQLQIHIKRMHNCPMFEWGREADICVKSEQTDEGSLNMGSDMFSMKKIEDCHFEPEVKRKRGRPRKIKQTEMSCSEQGKPNSDDKLNIKLEKVESDDRPFKLATYEGEFRLPLATKGFHFNFDKTGKKPKSWFMEPQNMYGKDAVKQRAYIEKRERRENRLNGGRIPRVRKISEAVRLLTRSGEMCVENDSQKSGRQVTEKDLQTYKLLVSGRQQLRRLKKKRRTRKKRTHVFSSKLSDIPKASTEDSRNQRCVSADVYLADTNKTSSDDEDNIPLIQLKQAPTEGTSGDPGSSLGSSLADGLDSSHIKLILKRKKEGMFKVTMNTSSELPSVPVDHEAAESVNVNNGGFTMVQTKDFPKRSCYTKTKVKQSASSSILKVNQKSNLHIKSNKSKEVCQKAGDPSVSKKNKVGKSKAKQSKSKKSKTKKKATTKTKSGKTSPKKSKAAKSGPKSKNPKTSGNSNSVTRKRGRPRGTSQSVQTTSKCQNIVATYIDTSMVHGLPHSFVEFPIKIEPPDEDILCQSNFHNSSADAGTVIDGVTVKEEFAHSGAREDESLPECKYLYDSKATEESLTENSYIEHALAWGLKVEPPHQMLQSKDSMVSNSKSCVDDSREKSLARLDSGSLTNKRIDKNGCPDLHSEQAVLGPTCLDLVSEALLSATEPKRLILPKQEDEWNPQTNLVSGSTGGVVKDSEEHVSLNMLPGCNSAVVNDVTCPPVSFTYRF